jgi:hypothetical protein
MVYTTQKMAAGEEEEISEIIRVNKYRNYYPCLYNLKLKDYHNRKIVRSAWQMLSAEVKIDAGMLTYH